MDIKADGHGILDELDIGWREVPYYQALAAHGLAIDNQENGIHLLNHAAYHGQLDIVNWLLDRGVDPNGVDPLTDRAAWTSCDWYSLAVCGSGVTASTPS